MKYEIANLFPTPLYLAHGKDAKLRFLITKEIKDLVESYAFEEKNKEVHDDDKGDTKLSQQTDQLSHAYSYNKQILYDSKFKKIKSYCEEHIATYVEKVLGVAEGEYDFYITQSWINGYRQHEFVGRHYHPNSIISGLFYIKNATNCKINFYDPAYTKRELKMRRKNHTPYNTMLASVVVEDGDVILFPGWLEHSTTPNNNTTDRISLAFNVFAKGIYGEYEELNMITIK